MPAEYTVWWHLAKVHKRLGQKAAALTALNSALDLQPPAADAALMKAAADKLHLEEARPPLCPRHVRMACVQLVAAICLVGGRSLDLVTPLALHRIGSRAASVDERIPHSISHRLDTYRLWCVQPGRTAGLSALLQAWPVRRADSQQGVQA